MALGSGLGGLGIAPVGYSTPPFPSLYWPISPSPGEIKYLYSATDIWRYTLIWTLLVYALFHLVVAMVAVGVQLMTAKSAWRSVWMIPVFYALIAGVEALIAGSIVGLILGAVYNAGSFNMSTWIPFAWSLINVLVLVISSFSFRLGL